MISKDNIWHTAACPSTDHVHTFDSLRCLFLTKLDGPPPPNPPEIVFTIVLLVSSRCAGLLSLGQSLFALPSLLFLGLLFLHSGLFPLRLRSWHRLYCFRPLRATYLCNFTTWIISSILSLRVVHSPVVWS